MDIVRPEPHSKLPANTQPVFKGVIFDVYQWQQELFDGNTTTFERLRRTDTVEVVAVLPEGNILLIEQQQPGTEYYLSLVAGRMEEGEKPFETIQRELLEETGYRATDWLLWDAYQPVHKIDWAVYTFVAKGLSKVSDVNLDGGEKIDIKIVSFEDFLNLAVSKQLLGGKALVQICEAFKDPAKKDALRKFLSI